MGNFWKNTISIKLSNENIKKIIFFLLFKNIVQMEKSIKYFYLEELSN